ncbi:ankyrin repeat domain-containing protein 66 [Synchiropus picturatus]
MTELHQAAAAGNLEQVLQILRKNKCSPNDKDVDWNNKTPLHWAAERGYTEIVRVLLEHGARPCLRTDYGWTPAHFAAESGHLPVLSLMHSFHAPLDKKDGSGDKPIRIAEIYGHKDCVQFLKGAEIEGVAFRKLAEESGNLEEDTDEEWGDKEAPKRKKRSSK